jgi:hypothetical protein
MVPHSSLISLLLPRDGFQSALLPELLLKLLAWGRIAGISRNKVLFVRSSIRLVASSDSVLPFIKGWIFYQIYTRIDPYLFAIFIMGL